MNANILYTPILKPKRGELRALLKISKTEYSQNILPLLDIHRVPLKYPEKQPKEGLQSHLQKTAIAINTHWTGDCYIDFSTIDLEARINKTTHFLTAFFSENVHKNWIPVTGFDRDDDYHDACKTALNASNKKICVRLLEDDLHDPLETEDNLNALLSALGVKSSNVHLILDIKSIAENEVPDKMNTVIKFINKFKIINKLERIVLSSSSFPDSLSGNKNKVYKIKRTDYDMWEAISNSDIDRIPCYGDYGIANPFSVDLNPAAIDPSAKIRYTAAKTWIIVKGESLRNSSKGYSQYFDLAKVVIGMKEFSGKMFSWGDGFIYDCATIKQSSGNLETWVKVDSNHHFTFVIKQLSSTS